MAKFKEISLEEAKRIQYDVQLYYISYGYSGPTASVYTPSDRREREAEEPGCWVNYWKNRKGIAWYIMVDDEDRPEYGEETG